MKKFYIREEDNPSLLSHRFKVYSMGDKLHGIYISYEVAKFNIIHKFKGEVVEK